MTISCGTQLLTAFRAGPLRSVTFSDDGGLASTARSRVSNMGFSLSNSCDLPRRRRGRIVLSRVAQFVAVQGNRRFQRSERRRIDCLLGNEEVRAAEVLRLA